MEPIPAVWRIDVEPDEFQPGPGRPPWSGFVAMAELVRQMRGRLEDLGGAEVHPAWFLRFDPEIGRAFGRVDFVVDHYRALFDELLAHHDPLGIHVHYHRWDEQRQVAYSDHADQAWTTHCVEVSAKTFEECFGEPVRRASHGGYFLDASVLDGSGGAGIEVDVTAEPGLAARGHDPSFGAYATAPSSDFRHFPRRPYYPSRTALGLPASSWKAARPMMMVPLTAYDYESALTPLARRVATRVRRRPRRHLPLNPWKAWPDPATYWDLMERAADEGPARYVAFAVRTDGPTSQTYLHARTMLEYLPRHPIARRLRFVDPLSAEIRALATTGMGAEGS